MATSKKTSNDDGLVLVFLLAVFTLILSFLFGCSSSYTIARSVSTDSTSVHSKSENVSINTKDSRDSVYARDSIYEYHMFRNDTVTHYIYRLRTEYRDRPSTEYIYKMLHDTTFVYKERCDSVPVIVEVTKEKPLTIWQRQKLKFGGMAEGIVLIELLILVIYFLHRKRS